MKVKELRAILSALPDEMKVILQKDGEGNGYSPLSGADSDAIYLEDSTWSGEVYDTSWTAEEACMDEPGWESFKQRPRCLILYPVN